jgi:hypothetical protein
MKTKRKKLLAAGLISFMVSSTVLAAKSPPLCPANLLTPLTTKKTNVADNLSGLRSGIPQISFASEDQSLADPYVEKTRSGRVRIFGTTNGHFLEYASEAALLHGQRPRQVRLDFAHPDGTDLNPDEMIWDSLPMVCNIQGKMRNVILGGAMTPPAGQRNAKWPEDNPGRRTYAFMQVGLKFVRGQQPVLPDKNPRDWIGHNYGRDFVRDENGQAVRDPKDGSLFMVYEKVTRKTGDGKLITELAMRKMKNCSHLDPKEIILMKINDGKPYPSVKRSDGGLLTEGPRVVRMKIGGKRFFVLGFSSGDFPTDRYGINLAFSENITGPYEPLLTTNSQGVVDLLDLGHDIRDRYQLTWGPARPTFYKDRAGQMWIVFHAVDKREHPGVDFKQWPKDLAPFQRQLYMAPLKVSLKKGRPFFKLEELRCNMPLLMASNEAIDSIKGSVASTRRPAGRQ